MKVRRAEFKRKRNAKRGWRRRHPLERLLKDMYNSAYIALVGLRTPLLDCLERHTTTNTKWGGLGLHFDVAVSGPLTTRVTSKGVVPVNYGEPGAASWRGKYG